MVPRKVDSSTPSAPNLHGIEIEIFGYDVWELRAVVFPLVVSATKNNSVTVGTHYTGKDALDLELDAPDWLPKSPSCRALVISG